MQDQQAEGELSDASAEAKFKEIFIAFYKPLQYYAYTIMKDETVAEEIVQEGFVQAFKSLNSFRQEGSFEGWIRKIMVHCAIQHYRSKPKMHLVLNIEPVNTEDSAAESVISQLSKKELLSMVQSLPPACRIVFNLHVFEGMKHREIAELLNISEGTSKSNFYDAKIILQRAVSNSLKVAKQNF